MCDLFEIYNISTFFVIYLKRYLSTYIDIPTFMLLFSLLNRFCKHTLLIYQHSITFYKIDTYVNDNQCDNQFRINSRINPL